MNKAKNGDVLTKYIRFLPW